MQEEKDKDKDDPHLFDLLRLEPDRLVVDKDSLPLIRLRPTPLLDRGREVSDGLFVDALEQ